VLCRKKGEADWQPIDAFVLERFHNVIFLEPATEYEFRVRRVAPDGSVRAESQVLAASTKTAEGRVWNRFQIAPDQRLATPPAVYPSIESVDGKLYYTECRGGTIWLSQLDESFQPVWTKPWVEAFVVDDVKYNSSPDITWHNGCLVYVYNKFEHLYGGRNDPGRLYGCSIGRLRPTVD